MDNDARLESARADSSRSLATDYRYLDATRWISAWLVVLFHIRGPHLERVLPIVRSGYVAVDFFFALSGFVMALRYRSEISASTIGFGQFVERRLARLYPQHVLTLVVAWAFVVARRTLPALVGGGQLDVPLLLHEAVHPLPGHLLLVHAFGIHDGLTLNGVSWSISAEMAAYLVFFSTAKAFRSTTMLALAWLATTVACCWVLVRVGTLNVTFDYGVFRCLAGFGIGVVTYLIARALGFRSLVMPPWASSLLSVVLTVPLWVFPYGQGEPFKLAATWALFVSFVLIDHPIRAWYARSGALRRASERSYAVYLVHGSMLLGLGFLSARLPGATFRAVDVLSEVILVVSFVAVVEWLSRVSHSRVEVPARVAWLARIEGR